MNEQTKIKPGAPLVLIHGWGSNARVWQPVLEQLEMLGGRAALCLDLPGFGEQAGQSLASLDELYCELEKQLPPQCHLLGWSLGGMVATQLAVRNPGRCLSLTTIASNARFVADEDWQTACAPDLYQEFLRLFSEDAEACFARFTQLQVLGDSARKAVLTALRERQDAPQPEQRDQWLRALHWLGAIDNRAALRELALPHLAIFGEHDKLVPAVLADEFLAQGRATETLLLRGASHAPHLSQPALLAAAVSEFIGRHTHSPQHDKQRDKQHVALSFSRAASHYDQLANLQRDVAEKLISLRDDYAGVIGDLGCGTGFCSAPLRGRATELIGIDIAAGMLQRYRAKLGEFSLSVCADFESLPFAAQSFDALVSSMSLQWSEALGTVFTEVQRVLKPGGWLLFSTLGPATLNELKQAWRAVDDYVHVNDFLAAEAVQQLAQHKGLRVQRFEREVRHLNYADIFGLMRELKCIGASNQNKGQNQGLTGKEKLLRLQQAYEAFRREGQLPATYEVYYFLLALPG